MPAPTMQTSARTSRFREGYLGRFVVAAQTDWASAVSTCVAMMRTSGMNCTREVQSLCRAVRDREWSSGVAHNLLFVGKGMPAVNAGMEFVRQAGASPGGDRLP